MHPLMGFALPHPEQASLHHLKSVCLQGGEEEEQPIFRRRQGTVWVHETPACGPRCPVEAPLAPMRVERRLKRRDEELKLVERHAGQSQALRGTATSQRQSPPGALPSPPCSCGLACSPAVASWRMSEPKSKTHMLPGSFALLSPVSS
jgi:hypothetical protein